MKRVGKQFPRFGLLDNLSRIHDGNLLGNVGNYAQSWVINHMAVPVSVFSRNMRSRICA